jgi:peptidoglycan/LPS O-acetylase OafA/YrhL
MPSAWLHNYEITKLAIQSPSLTNFLILAILALAVFASIRRSAGPFSFLERSQTDQLRGIAILLIILGHLWVHVSQTKADAVLAAESVTIFFVLSGYGLTVSTKRGPLSPKHFLSHRIRRVMVPYWVATIVLVILDYVLLHRTYSAKDLVMTTLGLNFTPALTGIDLVRWYLSLLLLWYVLFYAANVVLKGSKALVFLFAAAFVLFFLSYYKLNTGWYQLFGFPVGCLLGRSSEGLGMIYAHRKSDLLRVAVFGVLYVVLYKIVFSMHSVQGFLFTHVPNIIFNFILEVNGIVLCLGLMVLLARLAQSGRRSTLLMFFGAYSYELFLMHGAFLVKYDFLIRRADVISVVGSFIVFLAFASLVAFVLNKISHFDYGRRSRSASTGAPPG